MCPYITPYPTGPNPGLDEARLFAVQAMIVATLTDLNAALSRDALSPLTFTSAQIVLGDPVTVTKSLICVVGGGKDDATDMDITGSGGFLPRTDKAGYNLTLYTNIFVYIGVEDMPDPDPIAYVGKREIARARICDHLRKRVFNSQQGVTIQLASQEVTTDPDFDQLHDAHISKISKGMFPKGPGGSYDTWGAHLLHEGWVQ